ncbi:hypothetical protein FE257_010178 [Aspergillus nanangensis]|uniref:Uncharacterized protein n=1 Tax=Aspergillus nanangensis TaxID=2582783 RepID=A0AAD4CJA5_ASPNN|nr:hypothetical protein FE257_010178 [Aspergillus nanangensis]
MSEEALPITLGAFGEAIKELPLAVVYAKASELRNSISHLRRSNAELRSFVTESCDSDSERRELETYISENEDVVTSMTDRIMLLKAEVEGRGQLWIEEEELRPTEVADDGSQPAQAPSSSTINGTASETGNAARPTESTNGTRDTHADHDEDGVHL